MSRMQIPKKIRVEDFNQEQQSLVSKIAFVYNVFVDEVYSIMNKNIDFDNMNRQKVLLTVTIDGSGNVVNNPQIKTSLNGKVSGINVINATNLVNSSIYPTATPFITYTINADILTILHIAGLQNNSQYSLTLELIV